MAASGNLLKIRLGGGSAIQALTTAWVDAVEDKGQAVSNTQRTLVNALFRGLQGALETGTIPTRFVDIRLAAVESADAAYTTLVRLVTPTPHGADDPAFITWKGVNGNGSDQYDDWGIAPSGYSSVIAADNVFIYARAQTNVAELKARMGARNNAIRLITLYPRTSGNQVTGNLAGTAVTGPTITNEKQMIGLQRSGSTYKAAVAGVFTTISAPVTPGADLPTVNIFLGANNSNGTPADFRSGISAYEVWMSSVTDAELAAINTAFETYLAAAALLVDPDIWISSVNYGGIPIGNDSNAGTEAAPILTAGMAFLRAGADADLHFNGNPAAAPIYNSTQALSITDPMTVSAINALGAILAGHGTGSAPAIPISLTGGGTVTFNDLIIDPSENDSGPGRSAITIDAQPEFDVVLNRCQLQGQTSLGYLITESASDFNLNLTLTDCVLIGGDAPGNIDLREMSAGSITIDGGSSLMTACNGQGAGPIQVIANASGVTGSITDHDIDLTLDAGFSGAQSFCVALYNMPSVIANCTLSVDSPFVGSLPNSHVCSISQGRIGDADAQSISNSRMSSLVITTNAYGGSFLRMGDDDSLRALAEDCEIANITGTGDANFAANGGHCIWPVNTNRPWVHDFEINIGGIGLVDKSNWDGVFETFTVRRMTSSYILNKAALRSVYRNFFVYAYSGYGGSGVLYSVGDNNDTGVYGSGTFVNGWFENLGLSSWVLVNIGSGGFGYDFQNCTFKLTSGTMAASPFVLDGVSKTKAQFLALFPTCTCIGF